MKFKKIKIIGSKRFITQTKNALNLIREKSKRDFTRIQKYLKTIRQSSESAMILEKAQFNVSVVSAFHSVEWYASIIVHDTHHYYLHTIKKFFWEKKNFKEHERLCLAEQTRFLKKIKAPQKMIEHTENGLRLGHWRQSYRKRHSKW